MKQCLFIMVILLLLALTTGCGRGPKGDTGLAGRDGLNGTSCQVATTLEGAAITCPDGSTAALYNGIDGQDGINGLDGTQIVFTKVCPGVPTYPSLFPEYIFFVGNTAFGVYSSLGGFLTQLPPGIYTSNGVGSSCTFTINPNGTVSQ